MSAVYVDIKAEFKTFGKMADGVEMAMFDIVTHNGDVLGEFSIEVSRLTESEF